MCERRADCAAASALSSVGAGLGGRRVNARAVMVALRRLWEELRERELPLEVRARWVVFWVWRRRGARVRVWTVLIFRTLRLALAVSSRLRIWSTWWGVSLTATRSYCHNCNRTHRVDLAQRNRSDRSMSGALARSMAGQKWAFEPHHSSAPRPRIQPNRRASSRGADSGRRLRQRCACAHQPWLVKNTTSTPRLPG